MKLLLKLDQLSWILNIYILIPLNSAVHFFDVILQKKSMSCLSSEYDRMQNSQKFQAEYLFKAHCFWEILFYSALEELFLALAEID